MALTPHQESILSRADRTRVVQDFSGLPKNWREGRWLSSKNRYAIDCTERIKQDTAQGGHLRHANLTSYIAASAAVHCMDGWSYAGHAIAAELSGEPSIARHLAYYAELRAAMSLLARVGIGVFKRKHFAINKKGRCEKIVGEGTHVFAWDALRYWAEQSDATTLVLSVVQPGGKDLSEWLSHFPPTSGNAFRSILAKQWLLDWGLDLKIFALDREARNESSYRPTSFLSNPKPTPGESLDFVEHFWKANEPSGIHSFRELDRFILRRTLVAAFQAYHLRGGGSRWAPAQFGRLLEPMFHALMPTAGDLTEAQWRAFLRSPQSPTENGLVIQAEKVDAVTSPTHHLQVIARAVMLLRVATGAARQMLSGLSKADLGHLAFWWHSIGEGKGLWDASTPPQQLVDLWLDIDSALTSVKKWRKSGGSSRKQLHSSNADAIRMLGSCERVALWSLGL